QVSSDNLAKTSVSLAPSGDAGSLVAVLAADFRKKVDGVELVLVGESGLSLYAKGDGRSWTRTDAAIPLESQPPAAQDTFKAVDAAPYDTERNGIPKIIVLLAGSKGSRLQIFEVQSSGSLL